MRSKYLPVDVATVDDEQDVKGDRFTENMTVRQMVDNLLETGTPFDYKGVDFTKLRDKHEQFEADLADDEAYAEDDGAGGLKSGTQDAGVVAPMVGDRDIPVRDERYIDQRQERFDTAEPDWHVPTFEDEE